MEEHKETPEQRKPQHMLAREFVELVHGREEAKQAEEQHRALFSRPSSQIPQSASAKVDRSRPLNRAVDPKAPISTWHNMPSTHVTLPRSLVETAPMSKIVYEVGLANSRSEGHRMMTNKGVYVGARSAKHIGPVPIEDEVKYIPVQDTRPGVAMQYVSSEGLLVLRIGKWNVKICRIVDDEEYERSGAADERRARRAQSEQESEEGEGQSTGNRNQRRAAAGAKRDGRKQTRSKADFFA